MAPDDRDEPPTAERVVLDIVPSKGGFILRIGPVYLSLDREVTEQLMYLLVEALDPLGMSSDSN